LFLFSDREFLGNFSRFGGDMGFGSLFKRLGRLVGFSSLFDLRSIRVRFVAGGLLSSCLLRCSVLHCSKSFGGDGCF